MSALLRGQAYLSGDDRTPDGMNTPELRRVMEDFERFGVGYAQTFIAAVPEPGGCAIMGLLMCFVMRRRS
jgi:hypothetical protein